MAHWFWRKRFLNFVNRFGYFHIISPRKRDITLHSNKFKFLPTKEALCLVWLKLFCDSGRRFETFVMYMYFRYFIFISPWNMMWPFIWTSLNSLHPRMLCANLGWNWPFDFGGEDFKISSLYFRYCLHLEKGVVPNLNIIDSPLPKDALFQVWLKFGVVVLEKMKMW